MASSLTRLTFTVTKEMESELNRFKKEKFYNKNNSEMIRTLVSAGMRAIDESQEAGKEAEEGCTGSMRT